MDPARVNDGDAALSTAAAITAATEEERKTGARQALENLLRSSCLYFGASGASIYLARMDEVLLTRIASFTLPRREAEDEASTRDLKDSIPFGEGTIGQCYIHSKTEYIPDGSSRELSGLKCRNAIIVPVVYNPEEGAEELDLRSPSQIVGVMVLYNHEAVTFSADEIEEHLDRQARQAAQILTYTEMPDVLFSTLALHTAVLREVTDGLAFLGPDGRIVFANEGTRPLGLDSAVGRRVEEIFTGEGGQILIDKVKNVFEGGQVDVIEVNLPADGPGGKEGESPYKITMKPWRQSQDSSEVDGVIVEIEDLSAAEEDQKRTAVLIGIISHDLRTPLTSISGFQMTAQMEVETFLSGVEEVLWEISGEDLEGKSPEEIRKMAHEDMSVRNPDMTDEMIDKKLDQMAPDELLIRAKSSRLGQVAPEDLTEKLKAMAYDELFETSVKLAKNVLEARASAVLLQEYLEYIAQGSDRMLRLVEDVLSIVQLLNGGTLAIKKSRYDLKESLESLIQLHQGIVKNGTNFVLEISDEIDGIVADRGRIEQVIGNFLTNADKYAGRKGSTVIVQAALEPDDMVRIAVKDEGVGIPEKDLPNMFGKFFRVNDEAHQGISGHGLGLHLAKHLVEAHGGQIGVKSKVGEGSTFWVKLPLNGDD